MIGSITNITLDLIMMLSAAVRTAILQVLEDTAFADLLQFMCQFSEISMRHCALIHVQFNASLSPALQRDAPEIAVPGHADHRSGTSRNAFTR